MINFNSTNAVVVLFPAGSGGCFLMSALGLADNAVLRHKESIEKQLNGSLSQLDKLDYLKSSILNSNTKKWTDLGTGEENFMGFPGHLYTTQSTQNLTEFSKNFFPVISDLTDSDNKFFLRAHTTFALDSYLTVWNNASIIAFKNNENFLKWRVGHCYNFYLFNASRDMWKSYAGPDWPQQPKHGEDLDQYPKLVIDELIEYQEVYYNTIWDNILTKLTNPPIAYWDCNWYFNADDTVANIENLYNILGLTNFNKEVVLELYNIWISRADNLK